MSNFEDLALKYVLADDDSVQRDAAQSAAQSKHRTTLLIHCLVPALRAERRLTNLVRYREGTCE